MSGLGYHGVQVAPRRDCRQGRSAEWYHTMPPHFRRAHGRAPSAKERLRKDDGLHFLTAMDLVMAMCHEEAHGVYGRLQARDAAEHLEQLREMKHAASSAKAQYLERLNNAARELARQLAASDNPHLAAIGHSLQIGDYRPLAR